MISKIRNSKSAFTLVEIMIVVAIIGLLAALAIPGFVKARKQSQGRRSINDARMIDAAIDQWAIEKGKKLGETINYGEVATYVKGGVLPVNDACNTAFVTSATLLDDGNVTIAASTKTCGRR